jgi:hypothetical protein
MEQVPQLKPFEVSVVSDPNEFSYRDCGEIVDAVRLVDQWEAEGRTLRSDMEGRRVNITTLREALIP